MGDVGAKGVVGVTGSKGATGSTGYTGPTGRMGVNSIVQGAVGLDGTNGSLGQDGDQGRQGPKGMTGKRGPPGLAGHNEIETLYGPYRYDPVTDYGETTYYHLRHNHHLLVNVVINRLIKRHGIKQWNRTRKHHVCALTSAL